MNAVKRLIQMRDIAKRFTASDEFEGRPKLIGRDGLVDVYDVDVLWNVND